MSLRVYLLGVGIVLVALALAFTDWALSLQPGVTEANAKRIRPGMTLAEANIILGGPGLLLGRLSGSPGVVLPPTDCSWSGKEGAVGVYLDRDGRITGDGVFWQPARKARPGVFARLRDWLGW